MSSTALVEELLQALMTSLQGLVDASVEPSFPAAIREPIAGAVRTAEALGRAIAARRDKNDVEAQQIGQILEVLSGVAALDFSRHVEIHGDGGDIDAVAMITNMLAEELEASQRSLAERTLLLEQAKTEAEAATAAKSQFLANMSHEIRTPLTALLGFADLLISPQLAESDRLNYGMIIRRNGEHLLLLLNDILDLSKIEAGKLELEPQDCSLGPLLSGVVSLMSVRAAEGALDFDLHLLTPVPSILRTDPVRLRQILINLIGNAIKFTRAGSVRILVRYEPKTRPPRLIIDVVDTGVGMSAEQVSRLFQPFQQADPSMSRRFGGSGLGLAICKPLADALGGTLVVRSLPGEGSTFTLTLPAETPPGAPLIRSMLEHAAGLAESPAARPPERFAGSVLLVEDGADNQQLVGTILRLQGLSVSIAENGEEALAQVRAARDAGAPFDLILMDMQMPVLDGYAATSQLRRDGHRGPVVALTANAMRGERERCIAAGCDGYLSKPLDRAALHRTLLEHLRRSAPGDEPAPPGPPPAGEPARLYSTFGGEPELLEVLARFVQGLPAQIAAMREAARERDVPRLRTLAHRLKGAAGGYGFAPVTEAAARLERSLDDASGGQAGPLLAELEALCARVALRPGG